MKEHLKKFLLIYIFLLTIIFFEIIFWLNKDNCGLGFGIITYYIFFPLSTFIISLLYSLKNKRKYLLSLLFGILIMLFEYTTYSLANMLSFNKFNLPNFSIIFIYGLISLLGLLIGNSLKSKNIKI